MESAGAFGLYVHVPYCRARCHYCAFVFEPGHRAVPDDYVGRLEREIGRRAEDPRFAGRPVDSIYFGGGTPSLLTPKQMERVLAAARSRFAVAAAAEVSFEANPDRLETERLRGFRAVGANRLTLGWQALRAGHLSSLTRTHRPAENLRALERARAAGFGNVGVDLMFGLPRQTEREWEEDLAATARAGPEHVSAYELTFEEGTRLTRRHRDGNFPVPDEGARAAMFLATEDVLAGGGIDRYEISNFARPGRECRHNLASWEGGDILGVGASAASHCGPARWKNVSDIAEWSRRVGAGEDPGESAEVLDPETWAAEDLYLGLRLAGGVEFRSRLERVAAPARRRLTAALERARGDGHLELGEGRARLTRRGRLFSDSVFEELLSG